MAVTRHRIVLLFPHGPEDRHVNFEHPPHAVMDDGRLFLRTFSSVEQRWTNRYHPSEHAHTVAAEGARTDED